MSETPFDVVYSLLDITEHTVLPRSDEQSEDFWNKVQSAAFECPEALLLVWPIFGPLSDVTVLDRSAAPGEAFKNRQPFVTENPNGSKTFHPIALLPAIYPLLSQITASVGIFNDFLEVSDRVTELHDLDWTELEEAKRAGVIKFYCRDEDCKRQPYLYMTKKPKLSIKAREKSYVTLSEAVCAIYEWPFALREETLVAETALWEGDDWGCQTPMLPRSLKFWVSGLWGTDVIRQGSVESGEQIPWYPATGDECLETEAEWEELLEMARKRREDMRARGDGGHRPEMIEID
ncbi:hypothetical protein LY78DRAFT_667180 [Colletotrichum sublineola]|uniref:Uncharacterized protein n=1 Tax=Colletotrichum sublineola TaxID=1173701 RepID=A0A066X7R3_COLSU|nr:hypothetical protein LY78DRAFT_667180 [Colletotrichum sublineola]KDN62075.1 hypothetical protein CSUB01_10405 [Colletotrichum sublineola]